MGWDEVGCCGMDGTGWDRIGGMGSRWAGGVPGGGHNPGPLDAHQGRAETRYCDGLASMRWAERLPFHRAPGLNQNTRPRRCLPRNRADFKAADFQADSGEACFACGLDLSMNH